MAKFKVGDEIYPMFQSNNYSEQVIKAWRNVMPIVIKDYAEYIYSLSHDGLNDKVEKRNIEWVEKNFILSTEAIKILYNESKNNK